MKQLYIARSNITGRGMMIRATAHKGDILGHIKGELKFRINQTKEDSLSNPNWIGVAQNYWIDPVEPFSFINHACEPTAGIKGKVALIALRDLQSGEEISIDYSTVEADEQWEMECMCGSKSCRGIIRSIHFLPKRTFESYLHYVPKYFQRLYLKKDQGKQNLEKIIRI